MIDWFRGRIPLIHEPLNAGRLLSIDPDGQIEWETIKSLWANGSHESRLKIRSHGGDGSGNATELWIDGNISKFLQGHNLFGSRDLVGLVTKTVARLLVDFPQLAANQLEAARCLRACRAGSFGVAGIDINANYRLADEREVTQWLYAAEMRAGKRAGRATSNRGTVYVGQNSKRWAVKFYAKAPEFAKHGPADHESISLLTQHAAGLLRAEVRLLARELDTLGLLTGASFTPAKCDELYLTYLGRIEMNVNCPVYDEFLTSLPRAVAGSYTLWRSGVDLRSMLSKSSFYRHRQLLLQSGIDINYPCRDRIDTVRPLLRILEAMPVETPAWAYTLGLVA